MPDERENDRSTGILEESTRMVELEWWKISEYIEV